MASPVLGDRCKAAPGRRGTHAHPSATPSLVALVAVQSALRPTFHRTTPSVRPAQDLRPAGRRRDRAETPPQSAAHHAELFSPLWITSIAPSVSPSFIDGHDRARLAPCHRHQHRIEMQAGKRGRIVSASAACRRIPHLAGKYQEWLPLDQELRCAVLDPHRGHLLRSDFGDEKNAQADTRQQSLHVSLLPFIETASAESPPPWRDTPRPTDADGPPNRTVAASAPDRSGRAPPGRNPLPHRNARASGSTR